MICFFKKCFESLTVGGILILEPQSFDSYHKRVKDYEMEKNWKEIKLQPKDFPKFLIKEIGFKSFDLLGTGDSHVKGFMRDIYLFKK